jgi:hypothetical protein
MNVIKFSEKGQFPKTNIIYCIVDKTHLYSHNKEIIKNVSDWTIQNITIHGYRVLVSVDEDSLLREAALTEAKYAVVISTGTEFINGYNWFDYTEEYCQDSFFIAGHILDRKDFYYELHDQCYIINLNSYNLLGCPSIGKVEHFSSHVQIEPRRSDENFHDDYTPLWVSRGSEIKQYMHKAHGWNILSLGFKNNLTIKVFDDRLRNDKIHYYPEYTSYFDQANFLYARQGFCNGMALYLGNSERTIPLISQGPIEQLVVPASGLNWLKYLQENGYNENTSVEFYDYSFLTLEYIRHLVENWDGNNYKDFALSYYKNKFNFINAEVPYCGSIDNNIDTLEWNKIRSTVKFNYRWIDLMDSTKDLSWINNSRNTVINVTNIFNYIGTATIRSVKERVYLENAFISKLQESAPNAQIIFTRRAAEGFTNLIQNVSVPVKDLPMTNLEDLNKPSWHINDWSHPSR